MTDNKTSPKSPEEADQKQIPLVSPKAQKSDLMSNSGYSSMIKNQKRLTSAYGAKASARSDASTFAPPNITAFKIDTVGQEGSIINTRNQKIKTQWEAQVIESRVKKLEHEESKMMKKIEGTRRQAEKMQKIYDENNKKYNDRVQFIQDQELKMEEQKRKNKIMNEKSAAKKEVNKQKLFIQNKEVSKSLKNQLTERQKETEQDYLDLAEKAMARYQNQRSQEIRLKSKTQSNKDQTIMQAKKRYDESKKHLEKQKQQEVYRLQQASAQEDILMERMQNTMNQQKQALRDLEEQMAKNRESKKDRLHMAQKRTSI